MIKEKVIADIEHFLSNNPSLDSLIQYLNIQFGSNTVFSNSFSEEDQIIYHSIASNNTSIQVFTLDTGRLFPETYSTWSRTVEKYHYPIKAFYPDAEELQIFVEANGPNSFYESVEKRKECCRIRKVAPLKRALAGKTVWLTGIRAEHSSDRSHTPSVEWDASNNIIKVHPLMQWTQSEVKAQIKKHDIPYNALHDKGFVSIGCAPCTRAIRPGEDFRAGRWWWEDADKKECGLHIHENK